MEKIKDMPIIRFKNDKPSYNILNAKFNLTYSSFFEFFVFFCGKSLIVSLQVG